MTPLSFNLSELDGNNGFAINRIGFFSSFSVSDAGDINGDGIDDIIVGSYFANPNGLFSGQSYVIFGQQEGFNSSFNLSELNGNNGFAINGISEGDRSGYSVSGAGDINGDGIDDLIIGADSGRSYVVFGQQEGFSPTFELSQLNGNNGFILNGINPGDLFGISVSSAGDINGDGIDDLIIGASGADPNGDSSGQSYVVFGQQGGFSPNFDISQLNGSNGFAINGISADDLSGRSVSGAGDINGDGIDDLIIISSDANLSDNRFGQGYVVFGQQGGFNPSLELSQLNGINGFALNVPPFNLSGNSVSGAGDINNDGFDDLIIGTATNQSYVVFGRESFVPVVDTLVDENDGDFSAGDLSLREAIAIAENNQAIAFSPTLSGGTINLTLGELKIDRTLTIQGLGANDLTISGNNASRVFNIDDGDSSNQIDVTIDGLTIRDGNTTENGGGILNQENLTLTNSNISHNTAANGGGISSISGTLDIVGSNINSNNCRGVGGGIQQLGNTIINITNSNINNNFSTGNGAGIDANPIPGEFALTVTDSTLLGNVTLHDGGALSLSGNGLVNLNRSVVTSNRASVGGGIANRFGGQLNLERTIVANNFLNFNSTINHQDISGTATSGGFNVIGRSSGLTGITNGINNDVVNPVSLEDRLYFLTPDSTSWEQAQTIAQSYRSNLATINNALENDILTILFGNQRPWIGFNDTETEGEFQWVSGEAVTFTNWFPGEPNDDGTLGEDYTELLNNGRWNDLPLTSQRRGIVEINLNNLVPFTSVNGEAMTQINGNNNLEEQDILTGSNADRLISTSLMNENDPIANFTGNLDEQGLTEFPEILNNQEINALENFISGSITTNLEIASEGLMVNDPFRPLMLAENPAIAELNNSNNLVF
ncbi:lectin-like protein [Aerosakkonemataceae cyanobacterium BLCC-F154]|uniref:Lectin-like protein n=1 Tax=Floridaenema fluviatile BLCC-F154 TaxID=3153640 RepID=A0ABV4YCV1_9CYAN